VIDTPGIKVVGLTTSGSGAAFRACASESDRERRRHARVMSRAQRNFYRQRRDMFKT
jgi:hypothetical protein